jgi:hypothetical protein
MNPRSTLAKVVALSSGLERMRKNEGGRIIMNFGAIGDAACNGRQGSLLRERKFMWIEKLDIGELASSK